MGKALLTSGCSRLDKNFISTDTTILIELRGAGKMCPETIAPIQLWKL